MDHEFDSDLLKIIETKGLDSDFTEHLLRTLFNTFPDHMYLKDRNSKFILINESMVKLFKLNNAGEAVGKSDFDFFADEHANSAFQDEQAIMKSGEGKTNFIEKETWENGEISWVASTKVPFYDEDKNIIGLFGISRDITARKNAENELENRAKELECFIKVSKFARSKALSTDGYIKKIIDLIPQYIKHAGIISARAVIGHKALKCTKFKETDFSKSYRITENNETVGKMEIFFDRNIKNVSHRLSKDTDQVLKLIAGKISDVIEKKWIEKDLRKWEHIINDAEIHSDLFP